ncbi:MAG: aminotransferase class V-fold PLP-dependent enzyme [Nitrolancea sp.]
MSDLARKYELQPVINLSGPLTKYGTSISSEAVADAAAEALRNQWNMDELYQRSGELIAKWAGAEAGFLTSSSASGITLAVAACMTGDNRGRIYQLPDASGMKNEVVIQKGHAVNFGAPIEQMIRLAGATVREVGTVNNTTVDQIEHVLGSQTAAGMFVISHHTAQYGYVQLDRFVSMLHSRGIPVIIDAAAQDHQVRRLVETGADLIIMSVQKYLSGPTAGAVCGRADLIKSMYLQNAGIGRTMKVGKEGIFGTIAAIEERMAIEMSQWDVDQRAKCQQMLDMLQDIPGVIASLERDKVGQPVTRVRLEIDPAAAGLDAAQICRELEKSEPSIKPRAHHTDEGWFLLEPVHITEGEMKYAAKRLRDIVGMSEADKAKARADSAGIPDVFVDWLS